MRPLNRMQWRRWALLTTPASFRPQSALKRGKVQRKEAVPVWTEGAVHELEAVFTEPTGMSSQILVLTQMN